MARYTVQHTAGKPFLIELVKGHQVYAIGEDGKNILAFTVSQKAVVPLFPKDSAGIENMIPALLDTYRGEQANLLDDAKTAILLVECGPLIGIAVTDEVVLFAIKKISYHEGLYDFETLSS